MCFFSDSQIDIIIEEGLGGRDGRGGGGRAWEGMEKGSLELDKSMMEAAQ